MSFRHANAALMAAFTLVGAVGVGVAIAIVAQPAPKPLPVQKLDYIYIDWQLWVNHSTGIERVSVDSQDACEAARDAVKRMGITKVTCVPIAVKIKGD